MAKEVNIHVKTTGTQEAKQGLDNVAQSVEQMGSKTSRASSWIMDGLKSLIGPLGFAAIATAVAHAALKIATFFDNIKTKADEAVLSVQGLRAAYTDLFEALDAFDEKSRETITKQTSLLLQQTAVTKELGLPIITAYTRQFRGRMPQEQYERGLQEMLTYGARRNVEPSAMADLISIMAGWGMNTPEQQGEFRRMISAASQKSGLTEEDIIESLSRGMPTIKAMEWTPQQSLEAVAKIAASEVGRKKTMMPAVVLQALMTPQLTDIKKMGIPEKVAEDPQQLLAYLGAKRKQVSQKEFLGMLIKLYGGEAAPGVLKLFGAPSGDISETLKQAAGPAGIEAEQKEEEDRKTTLEAIDAATEAKKDVIRQDLTKSEKYSEEVRKLGAEQQKKLGYRQPVRQWFRELFTIGKEKEKEYAAFQLWYENLSPGEKEKFLVMYRSRPGTPFDIWQFGFTPEQKYEGLMKEGMPQLEKGAQNINVYNIGAVYQPPGSGIKDLQIGARMPP
ncbi:MAG: hypothetical protein MUP16_10000 [Sedimentisphaerales bacterium]|nr:hypothetical protein [Sedimentisphaerales bacterium]